MFAAIFILLAATTTVLCDECARDGDIPSLKLRKTLLCNYDRNLRPVLKHTDKVTVDFHMILKYFDFDEHTSIFTADSWISLGWYDHHLNWSPDDYDGITEFQITSDDIWVPDVSIYNRQDQSGRPSAFDYASCIVSSGGRVVCVPPSHQTSLCVGDLTHYPFDEQNCTVRFGSWIHSGEEIDLRTNAAAVTTADLVPNGRWHLVGARSWRHDGKYACCPNSTYPSLNYSFRILRNAGTHVASFVLPALALMILGLGSLWLAPNKNSRLILCTLNVVCQYLYLMNLSWMLPNSGERIPIILSVARDMLVLSVVALLVTVALRALSERQMAPPAWVAAVTPVVLWSRLGRYLFLADRSPKGLAASAGDEEGAGIVDANDGYQQATDWRVLVRILDFICFAFYFINYLFMIVWA